MTEPYEPHDRRERLVRELAGVEPRVVDRHLSRLGDDYFSEFSLSEVAAHIRGLSRLTASRPLAITVTTAGVPEHPAAAGAADAAGAEDAAGAAGAADAAAVVGVPSTAAAAGAEDAAGAAGAVDVAGGAAAAGAAADTGAAGQSPTSGATGAAAGAGGTPEPLTGAEPLSCTILAYDYPGAFSLITGALAAAGFAIDSGSAYTYGPAPPDADQPAAAGVRARRRPGAGRRRLARPRTGRGAGRRMLIDRFRGRRELPAAGAPSSEAWRQQLERHLLAVARDLEREAYEVARRRVSELVAETIRHTWSSTPTLYPVEIQITNPAVVADADSPGPDAAGSGAAATDLPVTRMRIVSQDTPLFLYSFSAALALRGVAIQRLWIRTVDGRVEDTVDVVDRSGAPIRDPTLLNQIKLSVLLTKQFAYFVGAAPDPYAALVRFEQLTEQVLGLPEEGRLHHLLAEPHIMQELALLLGSSDYLWEDFVRRQFETLLPMLEPEQRHGFSDPATVAARLAAAVAAAAAPAEKVAALNRFKDREAFLIDLEHVLRPGWGVRRLAARLTQLAECVVATALELATAALRPRFGVPRTVGGIDTRLAVVGLGKMGGRALGYASDIELMFIYSDQGRTTGPQQIGNGEYYEHLVRAATARISARRAGIFEVDLRLRPFGAGGPWAVSLESFTRYYGPGGDALAYERLALLRLRAVAGDAELGARLERLRDELVYEAGAIALQQVHEMRRRQVAEYDAAARLNAKFSPGTLVDVEYAVQMLQVRYGETNPALRTSSVHQALEALAQAGLLAAAEAQQIQGAYGFFRQLINGLRILRGSARDLYLPEVHALEYGHLARRMGYRAAGGLAPAQQLHLELETRRAAVRRFIDSHLGRGSLGSGTITGLADLVLSLPPREPVAVVAVEAEAEAEVAAAAAGAPPAGAGPASSAGPAAGAGPAPSAGPAAGAGPAAIFRRLGFAQPERALGNLTRLARRAPDRAEFARLAVLAGDTLALQSDPDRALNNWERFVTALDEPGRHFQLLLRQPTRLELLLRIFATSQFLADALVRSPELFDWVTEPERLHRQRRLAEVAADLDSAVRVAPDRAGWLRRLRALRRRELLRIAIRDFCLQAPVTDVMGELSTVAEAFVAAALRALADPPALLERTCILALGKLGAAELNYSSDIDLVALYDDRGLDAAAAAALAEEVSALARALREVLSAGAEESAAYRVDWRLRPYGSSGELAHSLSALAAYYRVPANDWEVQALLRMRPVGGNHALGNALLEQAQAAYARFGDDPAARAERVFGSIQRLRGVALAQQPRLSRGRDLKSGVGGLREIEFLVQGLQLVHLPRSPQLRCGNTLQALERLQQAGLLAAATAGQLRDDYLFLRRIEHFLQVLEDRQVHALPTAPAALTALARRTLGAGATAAAFEATVTEVTTRVHATYQEQVAGARARKPSKPSSTDRYRTDLAGADADTLTQIHHEDLAVADLAGARTANDGVDGPFQVLVVDRDLQPYLLQQVDFDLDPPIGLGVAHLLATAQGVGYRHLADRLLEQLLLDVVQLVRLNVGNY